LGDVGFDADRARQEGSIGVCLSPANGRRADGGNIFVALENFCAMNKVPAPSDRLKRGCAGFCAGNLQGWLRQVGWLACREALRHA